MVRTAVQLYTLRALGESLPSLLARVGTTAFDGVEFAGFGETSAERTRSVLEAETLTPAGAHVGVESLEDDPDGVASFYGAIECRRLVVPYLDETHFESASAVCETAARLETLARRWEKRGFDLAYHNHDHEFAALDGGEEAGGVAANEDEEGRSAFELFADESGPALSIELDVGWAVAAGYDPVELLERLDGRVPLVHLKDVDAADGRPVELGEGDVDPSACAAAARDAGTEWLIYEHDDPDDPAASLERGAEALDALRDGS
ncbi:sugar phosphate isomerase/epimerase family protein [Halovivax limisalsi]|uniref:sugar phosphate isomerase/epimerase family protein n=1 Tax=Halovivax limisalsi TaxID=1453760 RepID=UPI001FFC671A|nr:sugar phosphate isomerase/epimerase [Halovivax limisalsi]